MKYVLYYPATGFIWGCAQTITPPTPDPSLGLDVLAVSDDTAVDHQLHMIQNGQVVTLVPSLGMLKAAKQRDAVGYYNALFAAPAGFTYNGVLFQIDERSQVRISGLAQAAVSHVLNTDSAVPLPAYWIAADNRHVAMTAAQYYDFAVQVGNYVSLSQLNLRSIKDAILAASDSTTLSTIDITAGYPANHN